MKIGKPTKIVVMPAASAAPWRAVKDERCASGEWLYTIACPTDETVAVGVSEYNVALITAAPEMFAALESALPALTVSDYEPDQDVCTRIETLLHRIQRFKIKERQ
jgi:hypothetical protein